MLCAVVLCSMQAWGYRITDNYTIESKFKINAIGAGIAFSGYEGFLGSVCVWQFSVGLDGSKSVLRPHDWRVGGILLDEKSTGSVALNTTDWFVAKIVVSNNGNHVDTYLRRADNPEFTLIDSRDSRFDNEFRYGLIGARQDHDGSVNESASYDYFKVTANETGAVLYEENFESSSVDWKNDPIWSDGVAIMEGRNLSEIKYFPNNMFKAAVPLHYTVEADINIVSGYVSLIFGLAEDGSNYMWQISPNYKNDNSVCTYYHLDRGNENWKAHAAGASYPDFESIDIWEVKRHVMIEVDGNIVYTYIDGKLQDTFVQNDMTDLALLNSGKIGIRVDGDNGVNHEIYVDNLKLTEYDAQGNPTVKANETFSGGVCGIFELTGKNAMYASVVNDELMIVCDGTVDRTAKVRLIQTDVCNHNYHNGICSICFEYEEPGYDTELSAYTIGNLGQMVRFSQIVNTENVAANGSLLCDIDMEYSEEFEPIGLNNDGDHRTPFQGTFYGNNHVVRNLYVSTTCEGGLFSRLRGGKIYDLGLENAYVESTANLRCGALVGEHHDNAQMVNCYVRGDIQFVTSNAQTNALAGEAHGGHFFNCYTTLPAVCRDLPNNGTLNNCYAGVTAEWAATGELCYKLGDAFRQTIGEDTYPELDQTRGVVYPMSEVGYATLYSDATAGTLSSNVVVYTGEKNGNYLTLTQQNNTIPAKTAVVLKGTEGFYSFTAAASAPAIEGANDLLGTSAPLKATGVEYVLSSVDGVAGFYRAEEGANIPAGKAYLVASPDAKAYVFVVKGATGIHEVEGAERLESPIYNLAGQRMSKAMKGFNVVKGKVVLK